MGAGDNYLADNLRDMISRDEKPSAQLVLALLEENRELGHRLRDAEAKLRSEPFVQEIRKLVERYFPVED